MTTDIERTLLAADGVPVVFRVSTQRSETGFNSLLRKAQQNILRRRETVTPARVQFAPKGP